MSITVIFLHNCKGMIDNTKRRKKTRVPGLSYGIVPVSYV